MKKVLLDTNTYTAFKLGDIEILKILQSADLIGMSVVVLAELISGFSIGTKTNKNYAELNTFLASPRVTIFNSDDNTAHYYAQIYANLRRKGKPIPTNDLWIAACALQHGYKLCSYDKHFQFIDNLIVVSSETEFIL